MHQINKYAWDENEYEFNQRKSLGYSMKTIYIFNIKEIILFISLAHVILSDSLLLSVHHYHTSSMNAYK